MLNGFLEIDVHGMTRTQALTAIDTVLRRANGSAYRLQIIHGYHSGTVLRDAIRAHYRNHPKVIRIELGLNPLFLRQARSNHGLRRPPARTFEATITE